LIVKVRKVEYKLLRTLHRFIEAGRLGLLY